MKNIFLKTMFLASLVGFSSLTYSEKCQYQPTEDITVIWTAFKTPKKIGVDGKFPLFKVHNQKSHSSIEEILTTSNFEIDTNKVDTGNPPRDIKIQKFFFSTIKNKAIVTGTFKDLKDGKGIMVLKMNNVENNIPVNYEISKEGELKLTGKLNILSFGMFKQYESIHNACKALHEGNTWADVDVTLKANFKKDCK